MSSIWDKSFPFPEWLPGKVSRDRYALTAKVFDNGRSKLPVSVAIHVKK
jgi:hypothetical protein